jgi:putative transposase
LNNIIHVHRYVYNRTLDFIKNKGYQNNFINLRNLLATERTKMGSYPYKFYNLVIDKLKEKISKEKDENKKKELEELLKTEEADLRTALKEVPYINNYMINKFELSVSNEIRSNAIKSICDAYKSGFENLKNGNIKYFNPKFKSKTENTKCFELASSEISMKNGYINICPGKLGKNSLFKMSNKNSKKYGNIDIKNNCDLVVQKGLYFVIITVPTIFSKETVQTKHTICGGDPGIRTFLTTYNNKAEIFEYKNDRTYMKKLNDKLKFLKSLRTRPRKKEERNRYRKKQLNKIEKKKIDVINNLHWNVINHLVKTNDVIYYGDIKSHNIVKNNKNKTLNRDFNDLKFFIFKNRLLYKATIKGKKVSFTNESYTTQYCSNCGYLKKDVKCSDIYNCNKCKKSFGRDENSAKNIMMKGILAC